MEGTLGLPHPQSQEQLSGGSLAKCLTLRPLRYWARSQRPVGTSFTPRRNVELLVWHSRLFSGSPNLSFHMPHLANWFLLWLQTPLSPFLGSPFSTSPVPAPSLSQGLLWDPSFLRIPAPTTLSHHCLFVCLCRPQGWEDSVSSVSLAQHPARGLQQGDAW